MENGQDVHDNDQLVGQPEPVEDQATSRLSGVHVDNADTYNQEDTRKTCKNGSISSSQGNKLNVKAKNRKNSDYKLTSHVTEEPKVKGRLEFCPVTDFFKFRLNFDIIIKKGSKKFESLTWFEQNCLPEYNGIKDAQMRCWLRRQVIEIKAIPNNMKT